MGVPEEQEQDPGEVREHVLLHLPAVPATTKNFLRRAAAAASSRAEAETLLPSYVSSWAPSVSSGSGRVPTGTGTDMDRSTSPLDEDAGSTVSGACALGPACVSVALPTAAESIGMAFAEFRSREPRALPEEVISLIFRQLPIRDVFRIGYIFSRRWLEIWQGIPLVLHDVQLASDSDREILQTGERIIMNLVKKISRVLFLHPGPVELFRVDSSSWKEVKSLQWRVWIHKLISKNTKQIIICGRWPRSLMEFLPDNLAHCRSLQKLHLCFFSLPRITNNLAFPHLKELGLSHCVFQNSDLDSILCNCKLLNLTLGYVKLPMLSIRSETLRSFTVWKCTIDFLCLSGTPNLSLFFQEPGRDFCHRSHLQFRGIPKLRVISTIFLNHQTVELCGYHIKADMLDYPLCWSVTRLQLVVNFSSKNEIALIPALLNCFPKLQSLMISRFDSHESYTGPPIDWQRTLSTLPCIKTSLVTFELCNCHGDDVENDLASAVSACAMKLKNFQIELHSALL